MGFGAVTKLENLFRYSPNVFLFTNLIPHLLRDFFGRMNGSVRMVGRCVNGIEFHRFCADVCDIVPSACGNEDCGVFEDGLLEGQMGF